MIKLRSLFTVLIAAAALCFAALAVSLSIFLKPEALQEKLDQTIESWTHGKLEIESLRIVYFPRLMVRTGPWKFETAVLPKSRFSGQQAAFSLNWWKAAVGKIEMTAMGLDQAELFFKLPTDSAQSSLSFQNARARISHMGSLRKPLKLEIEADYGEVSKAIRLSGKLRTNFSKDWDWKHIGGELHLAAQKMVFPQVFRWLSPLPAAWIQEGVMTGDVRLAKTVNSPAMSIETDLGLEKITYRLGEGEGQEVSLPMDGHFKMQALWDAESELMSVERSSLLLPFGTVEAAGGILWSTGELKDVRVTASQIQAEQIPQYVLPLKNAIPLNLGFSGTSGLELSLRGVPDHMTVDGNIDFTSTLLTYGRFFSKPKEMPMRVGISLLVQDGSAVSGDFSVRLKETTFKGTLTGIDFQSGQGQLNMITNKFSLTGWEALIPPLSDFLVEGNMKVLLNMTGPFQNQESLQNTLNVTLEDGRLSGPDWPGIHGVNAMLDYSPLSLELRRLNFRVGEEEIQSKVVFYNLKENLNFEGQVESPQLKISETFRLIKKISNKLPETARLWADKTQAVAEKLLPHDEALEKFHAAFRYHQKHFKLEPLTFSAYGGWVTSAADFDLSVLPPPFTFETEINKLNLARYLKAEEDRKRPVNGNVFLKLQASGEKFGEAGFENSLTGQGQLSITAGDFNTFDVLQVIGEIEGLGEVGLLANQTTSFGDFRTPINIFQGKISMANAVMISQDLTLEAKGELFFDGRLNYRADAYLSPALTDHFLTPLLGKTDVLGKKQFGPIPLLLSGPIAAPELKIDPLQIEDLRENLQKKRTQRILRNFVPEDQVF